MTDRSVTYTDLPVERYTEVLVRAGLPQPVCRRPRSSPAWTADTGTTRPGVCAAASPPRSHRCAHSPSPATPSRPVGTRSRRTWTGYTGRGQRTCARTAHRLGRHDHDRHDHRPRRCVVFGCARRERDDGLLIGAGVCRLLGYCGGPIAAAVELSTAALQDRRSGFPEPDPSRSALIQWRSSRRHELLTVKL